MKTVVSYLRVPSLFFFLSSWGCFFNGKSQVLPQKPRRETNANPHRVAHLQPEAEKLLNGWSKINACNKTAKNIARSNKKGHFSEGLGIGTPNCLKNLLVVGSYWLFLVFVWFLEFFVLVPRLVLVSKTNLAMKVLF